MNTREIIENILRELVPGIDVASGDLIEEDGVGSMTMIQLISELDLAFDIEITFDDIEYDHFRSVDAIEQMVLRYLQSK